ncbi:MAG: DNA-3-methyladenine glycosylase [Rhodothermales bacterium]|nr:DNA-3-methyladenine glycosylase [Rhodothermales bacterium]
MSLPYDPGDALRTLRRADATLGALIDRIGPFRLERRPPYDPFQALARSIIYQQLSGKAAATIHGRVLDLFPDAGHPTPQQLLDAPDDVLRSAGVSRNKVAALKDLAAKTLDGVVPPMADLEALDDHAVIERLTQVRGVGRWTAEMVLLFYMGRPDVLPATDLGVQKGFMLTYDLDALPTPKALTTHGERWRPYRSVAAWYLWRAVDSREG